MNRLPHRDVIDLLSEEDTDGQDESENLFFDAFMNDDVSGLPTSPLPDPMPAPYTTGPPTVYSPYEDCLAEILEVFPDISREHVQSLYNNRTHQDNPYGQSAAQILIDTILDAGKYPKERDRIKELKRKRSDKNSDEEEAARWKYADLRDNAMEYSKVAKVALHEAFAYVPSKFINEKFKEHGHYYGAFFSILEAQRSIRTAAIPPYAPLRARRVSSGRTSAALMIDLSQDGFEFEELKREIDSAQQRRNREEDKINATMELQKVEEAQDQEHRARGEIMDCACCFDTVTTLKITHCNGDEPHFFCLDCAKQNANTDIGNSRWALRCMDGSGCAATFSRLERERFLDTKSIEKLERLQQQDEIRLADLPNLCTCPFCDFAAICPPIEEDKEFRCHNPECEEVSCRLCKAKSHVPLSCDEFKKENGISERRVIEEARTEALIRTCGKCKVRILKEDGCNKVICTKCYAVLCDYCGKDISKQLYNHFDGQGRAPPGVNTDDKTGKCPLYDESHKRKDQQVDKAEKDAMAKVRAEHPDLSEEDLKIKFAQGVQSSNSRHPGVIHNHFGNVPPYHYRHRPPPPPRIPRFDVPLYNGEPGAALDAFLQHRNMMDEFGQQAMEREREVRERMMAANHQALQDQLRFQREALFRHNERTNQLHQEAVRRQEVMRDDLIRRLDEARRATRRNEPAQTRRAPGAVMENPTLSPVQDGPWPAPDVMRPRHNDQAFGNNAGVQNVGGPDGTRARGQLHENHPPIIEERLRGLDRMRDPGPAGQRREINEFRRRTAELNAERAVERAIEARPRTMDPLDLNPRPQTPGEYQGVPRRRDPVVPNIFNPWVAGANDQAYLWNPKSK